jgi:hypothetical protein
MLTYIQFVFFFMFNYAYIFIFSNYTPIGYNKQKLNLKTNRRIFCLHTIYVKNYTNESAYTCILQKSI